MTPYQFTFIVGRPNPFWRPKPGATPVFIDVDIQLYRDVIEELFDDMTTVTSEIYRELGL